MGILIPNDDTAMWVFLQSFPDDDILKDKYIYNFGIMDEEMKRHVGEVFNYGIYLQTIVEMKFSDFRDLYKTQSQERELLYSQYPGLIIDRSKKQVKKKKGKTPEEQEKQKEKMREYQHEYYERVTKSKREEKRKLRNNNSYK